MEAFKKDLSLPLPLALALSLSLFSRSVQTPTTVLEPRTGYTQEGYIFSRF